MSIAGSPNHAARCPICRGLQHAGYRSAAIRTEVLREAERIVTEANAVLAPLYEGET